MTSEIWYNRGLLPPFGAYGLEMEKRYPY